MISIHDCLLHISGASNFYFAGGLPYSKTPDQSKECSGIKTASVMKSFLTQNEKALNASDFVSLSSLKERYKEWENDADENEPVVSELIDYLDKIIPIISDRPSCHYGSMGMKPGIQPPATSKPAGLTFTFKKPAPSQITIDNVLKRSAFAQRVGDKAVLKSCEKFIKKHFAKFSDLSSPIDSHFKALRFKNKEENCSYINELNLIVFLELVVDLEKKDIKVSLLTEGRVILFFYSFPTLEQLNLLDELDEMVYFEIVPDFTEILPNQLLTNGRYKRLYYVADK